MTLKFFDKKRPVFVQSDFELLPIGKRKLSRKVFWDIDSPGPIPVNVKLAGAFFHQLSIVRNYINVFISLQIRNVYILTYPYGSIQLNGVKKNED